MDTAASTSFFDNNQLLNRKKVFDPLLKALSPNNFAYYIHLLVHTSVVPNSKLYRIYFISSLPFYISRKTRAPVTYQETVLNYVQSSYGLQKI